MAHKIDILEDLLKQIKVKERKYLDQLEYNILWVMDKNEKPDPTYVKEFLDTSFGLRKMLEALEMELTDTNDE